MNSPSNLIIPLYRNDNFPEELKQNPCLGVSIINLFCTGGNGIVPADFSKYVVYLLIFVSKYKRLL